MICNLFIFKNISLKPFKGLFCCYIQADYSVNIVFQRQFLIFLILSMIFTNVTTF